MGRIVDREEFIQTSSAYVLGSVAGDELERFETYLAQATVQEREILAELAATASLLPIALDRQNPSPDVKQDLMQRIALSARAHDVVQQRVGTAQQLPRRGRNWIPWGIAASLAMVAVFSFFVFKLMGTIERQNEHIFMIERENRDVATRLIALRDELTRKDEQLKVLSAKQIYISIMDGMNVNPVGYGKIIWDPEKGTAILQVANLPAVPSGMDYQLWVIKGKQPISAGVFAVHDTKSNFFKLQDMAVTNPKEITAFAITLEPEGGMPQPTGNMYMMSTTKL